MKKNRKLILKTAVYKIETGSAFFDNGDEYPCFVELRKEITLL